ncbi:hypothetical protein E2C01_080619 [Portunus trituberculatus]|uniref:Uncharacterized protein n=1 Tax=Portunus trituberculatus TaxID=210409 RepID=A0A5B7IPP0_PORTR|nr:hypothetical protein [Portunus trituberculatus]
MFSPRIWREACGRGTQSGGDGGGGGQGNMVPLPGVTVKAAVDIGAAFCLPPLLKRKAAEKGILSQNLDGHRGGVLSSPRRSQQWEEVGKVSTSGVGGGGRRKTTASLAFTLLQPRSPTHTLTQ